ncbi:hypothetical protein GPEL0_01f0419 [Geoanaerobacter pelophilus]|uniref:RadC-like JAB domain-containing protein n=1 Tax=Geoanaerobacter pelophilus TaxID=60036 RepID=A0ABQ0MEF9_9BACT|nr:hypothetical protein GPEL0_01f0419 [Geoanaerobacter pelophilus]
MAAAKEVIDVAKRNQSCCRLLLVNHPKVDYLRFSIQNGNVTLETILSS